MNEVPGLLLKNVSGSPGKGVWMLLAEDMSNSGTWDDLQFTATLPHSKRHLCNARIFLTNVNNILRVGKFIGKYPHDRLLRLSQSFLSLFLVPSIVSLQSFTAYGLESQADS